MNPLLPTEAEALDFIDGNEQQALNAYRWRNNHLGDSPAYSWGLFLDGMLDLGLLTSQEVKRHYCRLVGA